MITVLERDECITVQTEFYGVKGSMVVIHNVDGEPAVSMGGMPMSVSQPPTTNTGMDAIALLREWVTLEHQEPPGSHKYIADLSKRTYAVLAQQHQA